MTAAIRRSHDRSFLRLLVAAAALLLALGAAAPGGARAQAARGDNAAEEAAARQKLEAVRAEIRKLTDAQKAASLKRGDAATALRQADEAVAAAAKELRTLDGRLAAQQARLDELAAQRAALDARLEDQRAALAELVRSAYVMGRDEELKLLLAQDRIDIAGRLLVYYRYFERARLKEIEALLQGLAALARIEHAIADETAALGATRAARAAQLRELDGERSRRRQLLDAIDAELADQRSRLAALGKDEKSLLELLARLRDIFADIPKQLAGAEPFAQLRGRRGVRGTRRPADRGQGRQRGARHLARSRGLCRLAAWLRPAADPRSRRRLSQPVWLQRESAQGRRRLGRRRRADRDQRRKRRSAHARPVLRTAPPGQADRCAGVADAFFTVGKVRSRLRFPSSATPYLHRPPDSSGFESTSGMVHIVQRFLGRLEAGL